MFSNSFQSEKYEEGKLNCQRECLKNEKKLRKKNEAVETLQTALEMALEEKGNLEMFFKQAKIEDVRLIEELQILTGGQLQLTTD